MANETNNKRIPNRQDPPKRSVLEETGNSVTHGVGAVFAIVATVLMYISADTTVEYVGATVYGLGLFIMFTMSTLYHAFPHGSAVKRLFRRFDYSCIYILISLKGYINFYRCFCHGKFIASALKMIVRKN